MNTKEFYSVLVPLINLILTGSKELSIEDDRIKLSEEYKFSMEEYAQEKQSTNFHRCIHEFLDPLNQKEREDIFKIIIDNDVLLTTAILTDLIESKKPINGDQDNEAEFNKMMFEFLTGININSAIYRVLYMYLENLHRLNTKEFTISKFEYNRVLLFNNQKRSKREIFNMFT